MKASFGFEQWSEGYGVIQHNELTQVRVLSLLKELDHCGLCSHDEALKLFMAADKHCNMGLWLTAHMTYANNVYLDGRSLDSTDCKPNPEGHTGGALNIVPAYVGYLLANALSGKTRAWMMGQGHCVAAIDAINILMRNVESEQDQRYPFSDNGLTQLVRDFYGYAVNGDGKPSVPLGSHVNVYTAGGIIEGGYLGFAELQYVHMPLPGQELVTFLSDGAFEEQRGSDWASRWWRGEDNGLVMPIMIANGRRIDQRSTMSQCSGVGGGVEWFRKHLKLNGFEPIDIDGRDPAAFAWSILSMAKELENQHEKIKQGLATYPVLLPYTIAETVKGFGFAGSGTNAAHNLPLSGNPSCDIKSLTEFNDGCKKLFVPINDLQQAIKTLSNHQEQHRVAEKDHYLRQLQVKNVYFPATQESHINQCISPMAAVDHWFSNFIRANPHHRIRVGNPDEMRSNRMNETLDALQHRVTAPESTVAESLTGSVITALNEEAVISSVLANKQGINIVVSYEAFALKMLGAMRQEAIFARHLLEAGRSIEWFSVPLMLTSHTWENGKNEQSHQDPTLGEAWLGEMADIAPVYFPFDANSAVALMGKLYQQRGRIAAVIAAKNKVTNFTSMQQAVKAVDNGAFLQSHDDNAQIQLFAIGSYQLEQVMRAADCLRQGGIKCSVVAIIEPSRFRIARDKMENDYVHSTVEIRKIIPFVQKRLFVCHTRAEVITGVLRPLDTGTTNTHFIGYRNRGGTFDIFGMQYANGQTWAHIVQESLQLLNQDVAKFLPLQAINALMGKGDINVLR